MDDKKIYWFCQFIAWTSYAFFQIIIFSVFQELEWFQIHGIIIEALFYLLSTHLLRYLIIKMHWLDVNLGKLLIYIFFSLFIFSTSNYLFHLVVYFITAGNIYAFSRDILTMLFQILGNYILYLIWLLLYLGYYFFDRYRYTLKLQSFLKEVELENLKSQLRPHFIFNSLNGIRALIDEDPVKSRTAIIQLSDLLRYSLNSNQKAMISLKEELLMVKNYLRLELIRFEDRLHIHYEIEDESLKILIPSFMLQTLVENAIKHGICNQMQGGKVSIKTKINKKQMILEVRNTGQLEKNYAKKESIGLKNTTKRLKLIYEDAALFLIINENIKTVLVQVTIPI